jgi:hypothetical protein
MAVKKSGGAGSKRPIMNPIIGKPKTKTPNYGKGPKPGSGKVTHPLNPMPNRPTPILNPLPPGKQNAD